MKDHENLYYEVNEEELGDYDLGQYEDEE